MVFVSHTAQRELLLRAVSSLRGEDIPLVFGGLGRTCVPVSVCNGYTTPALTKMVIRPRRGLGGRVLVERRPLAVPRYERAPGISHDYDEPVLGEGVVGLAAAPVIRGGRVCGLLYAATRRPSTLNSTAVERLAAAARSLSHHLSALDGAAPPQGELPAGHTRRILEIAHSTRDPATQAALLALLPSTPASGTGEVLTPRQRQVLQLAEIGLRNAEIAARLGLSEHTVKTYMRALMARLGARTRQEAVHAYQQRAGR